MNLLSVAKNILDYLGAGSHLFKALPIETLVKKINESKSFQKSDKSPVTIDELSDLIVRFGKKQSIQIDSDGNVRKIIVAGRYISIAYVHIVEMLGSFQENNKLISISILFYSQISKSSDAYYNIKALNLLPFEDICKKSDPKKVFLQELKRLNQHKYFTSKLSNVINSIALLEDKILCEALIFMSHKTFIGSESDFAIQFEELLLDFGVLRIESTPLFIREIISSLVISKPFNHIYTPAIRIGEVFSSIQSKLKNTSQIEFAGDSAYDNNSLFGTMNFILHEFQNFNISSDNPLHNSYVQPNNIDCVVFQPPFGGSSSINDWQFTVPYLKFGQSKRLEILLLQFIIHILNEKGRAYIILPEGLMFSENATDKAIRKYLIENDFIDSVISFPAGTYENTRIKTDLLVIDKNKAKSRKGKVLFFDTVSIWATLIDKALIEDIAHNTAELILDGHDIEKVCESISNQQIIENNYRLQVSQYVNSYTQKLRNIIAHGETVVKIKDILTDIKFQNIASESGLAYIKGGDLSKDPTDPYLYIKDENHSSSKVNGKIIDDSAILVARIGGNLNPTIFFFDGEPIVVNQNVYALPINSNKINLQYFALELNSEFIKEQLSTILVGASMRYYNYNDLLELQIRLPELSEQKKRVSVAQEQILAFKKKELGLEDELIKIKKEQQDDLSIKKHNIMQYLNNVKASADLLYKEIQKNGVLKSDQIINPNTGSTVNSRLLGMIESINHTLYYVDNITNDQKFDIKKDTTAITLVEKAIEHGLTNPELFEIDLNKDEKSWTIYVDSDDNLSKEEPLIEFSEKDFIELYNNILENAINHSFTDKSKRYIFKIDVSASLSAGNVTISFSNNGTPFPLGMAERYCIKGEKAGKTGNKGIGTWKVCEIAKHFGAEIEVFDLRNEKFPVKIDLIIPFGTTYLENL